MSIGVVIAATQSATQAVVSLMSTVQPFMSTSGHAPIPPTIWAHGLGSGESVELQLPKVEAPAVGTDAHWETFDTLTPDQKARSVFGTALIRVKKGATAGDVGVMSATAGNR